jgi:16S rRNA (adenine1518-N6/adenine1519-N6)-dimethyltransferase
MIVMKNKSIESSTRELIKRHNFRISKKFGQNFLVDESVLKKIIEGSELSKEDCVLEIGPGMGVMTQLLSEKAGKVLAVEIDRNLIPILKVTLFGYSNITLINDDIMQLDLKKTFEEHFGNMPVKVVANLPYYITTPILMKLLEEDLPLSSITIMVQKEVGERLSAEPGSKAYGALTVAVQYYSVPNKLMIVPSEAFVPKPEVESMVIRLDIRETPPVSVKDEKLFFKVVKAAFGQRRKTLLNALSSGDLRVSKEGIKEILDKVGIDENRRGETLSLEEFATIADEVDIVLR